MNANLIKAGIITIFTCLILSSCSFLPKDTAGKDSTSSVNIIIEENDNLILSQNIYEVPYNSDLTLHLTPKEGVKVTGCDYNGFDIKNASDGYELTLYSVKYSSVISIDTLKSDIKINYCLNAPVKGLGLSDFSEYPLDTHIKLNTAIYSDSFYVTGYTLTGWNTKMDGSGLEVCLGGRIDKNKLTDDTLYGSWAKWTDESFFIWEENSGFITITGFNKDNLPLIQNNMLVIPGEISGKKVTAINENAFEGLDPHIDTVVLSPEIKNIAGAAFLNSSFKKLIIYDLIESISDYSFEGCTELKTLRINAATLPVYCGSYYATFPDKMDYLEKISSEKPRSDLLVLFSGSSTRFGYDSPALEKAFENTKVANMGVFAYTNALPQLDLILEYLNEGDILLDSPEFDASRRQFCVLNKFDDKFFNMIEGNYQLMEMLDQRSYTGVFSAFNEYQTIRRGMDKKSYDLSPSGFDENFNPVDTKSYNAQGDYSLFRPNAKDDTPVFDLPVDYTVAAFPKSYIDALNAEAKKFTDKGIEFLFTYAPRNKNAISPESTPEKRKELDEYLRESLDFPVISDIEDSLYEGRYLFETDNHLSTEGVIIRTSRIIEDLKKR